jgi:inosose dehydratase
MIRVANAPCSWGVLEFQPGALEASGVARIAPFTQVLDEIAATGYDGTELGDWGFMPTDSAALRAALAERRLQLLGAFVPIPFASAGAHAAGREVALRTARLMRDAGADQAFIVLSDDNASVLAREQHAGRITAEHMLDERAWETFARGAEHVARAVREATGLRTVFHPHCGGYVETPAEVDHLMARTDAAVLGLVLDTGHLVYGGGDPLDVLDRHAARVWHVHFKDCDPVVAARARQERLGYLAAVGQQLFCELGAGAVEFEAVVRALERHGYDGWIVVEQDVFPGCGTPVESARRSREYLRRLGL